MRRLKILIPHFSEIFWGMNLTSQKKPNDFDKKFKLLKLQKGKCNECGLIFKDGDIIEIDHIKPKKIGLNNSISNN